MGKVELNIDIKPSLVNLSQIQVPAEKSGTPEKDIKKLSEGMGKCKTNFALPLVCLTGEEDKYKLLTGLPIYEAAAKLNLEEIWVIFIDLEQPQALEIVEAAIIQFSFNEPIVASQVLDDFLKLLTEGQVSDLVKIPGIKEKTAQSIIHKRPYSNRKDLEKHGPKRPLNWLKAYSNMKNAPTV